MAKAPARKPIERWQVEDAKRLRALFEKKASMSQEKFGSAHGIGTQGAVWQYLEGRIPLNLSVALKFAAGLECELDAISPTLAGELNKVRQTSSPYNVTDGPTIRAKVPLISWTTAGAWVEAQDPHHQGNGDDWVPTTAKVGPNAFALRVIGDSMEPKIPDGSIVIIDPARQHKNGSIVLAKRTADQEATLKQLWYDGAVPKLRPLNTRYSILDMPDDTRIIGVAVRLELDL